MHRGTAELTISPHNAFLASAETSGSSFIARLNYKIRYRYVYLCPSNNKRQNCQLLYEPSNLFDLIQHFASQGALSQR